MNSQKVPCSRSLRSILDRKYVKENYIKTGGIKNERYFNEAVT